MSGHTPGPWVVDKKAYNCKQSIRQVGPLPRDKERGLFMPVCRIAGDPRSKAENDANAILIAAAPELLEALNSILDCISETRGKDATDAVAKARAAIAKAEGKQ